MQECLKTVNMLCSLDSDCSRHMTKDTSIFIEFVHKERDYVAYGHNYRCKILGEGILENISTITICVVLLVK